MADIIVMVLACLFLGFIFPMLLTDENFEKNQQKNISDEKAKDSKGSGKDHPIKKIHISIRF